MKRSSYFTPSIMERVSSNSIKSLYYVITDKYVVTVYSRIILMDDVLHNTIRTLFSHTIDSLLFYFSIPLIFTSKGPPHLSLLLSLPYTLFRVFQLYYTLSRLYFLSVESTQCLCLLDPSLFLLISTLNHSNGIYDSDAISEPT